MGSSTQICRTVKDCAVCCQVRQPARLLVTCCPSRECCSCDAAGRGAEPPRELDAMPRIRTFRTECFTILMTVAVFNNSLAAATLEQKKELKIIGSEITRASSLTTQQKFEDAAAALTEVEEKLAHFIIRSSISETDSALKPIRLQLEKAKTRFGRAIGSLPHPQKQPSPTTMIEIARPTGNEKVSFIKEIAPTLVNICAGCHNEDQKRGGLSMTTFEKLMQGGDSGRVVIAGNLAGSKLFELLTSGEMPRGEARFQKQWYADVGTWIEEGAKFDASDAKRPLRQLIPTDEEVTAEKLARLTPKEFAAKRLRDSEDQWRRTFPTETPSQITSNAFLVMGNVTEDRLRQIDTWASDYSTSLRQSFNVPTDQLWKGRLTIFVFKERFGYEEFSNSVHKRDVPREIIGHSQVVSTMDEAFIAIHDVGDEASDSSPGMQLSLIEHLTGAFLKRSEVTPPDWLVRGVGLALANHHSSANPYLAALPSQASRILKAAHLAKPEEIFVNGTFAPSDVGPIGFTLVRFMMTRGGPKKFNQFLQRLQEGETPEAALQKIYQTDGKVLALAYANALATQKGKK